LAGTIVLAAAPVSSAELTVQICEADFQAMLISIGENRASAVREIDRQLLEAPPEKHPALKDLKEAAWMQEESERVQAHRYRTDCLKAVKR
jgi:hypothetical protein